MTKLEALTPVTPIAPALPYIGGKRLLAKRLCHEIDQIPHRSYVEPFCGMGGVFFRRASRPKCEVINDLNRDVANFFRVVRKHQEALISELRYLLTCREEFARLKLIPAETLTDIERAARFFYLQRCAFGGVVSGRTFGVQGNGQTARFSSEAAIRYIEAIHTRLQRVVIESLPYQEVLARYDYPETLFYLDPPYWGHENDYGEGLFSQADFLSLATCLTGLKGRFIMSINDAPEVRDIFRHFSVRIVQTNYTKARKKAKRVNELIICN